jgi:hypothetical protein
VRKSHTLAQSIDELIISTEICLFDRVDVSGLSSVFPLLAGNSDAEMLDLDCINQSRGLELAANDQRRRSIPKPVMMTAC